MNRELIENYIDSQAVKVVTKLELDKNKIAYDGIIQRRAINDCSGDEEMPRPLF